MVKKVGETIHVGRRIKERVAQMPELTAKALASKMNMHEQTLYDVYRRSSVDTDKLLLFSEILNVPLTYFFSPYDDGKDNKTPAVKSEASPVSGSSSVYPPSSPGSLLTPARSGSSSTSPARAVADFGDSARVAPAAPAASPEKRDEAAALRQELETLTSAFNAFRQTVETRLSELQSLLSEPSKRSGEGTEPLLALQAQRIRELEALNQERALLLEALLKRYL